MKLFKKVLWCNTIVWLIVLCSLSNVVLGASKNEKMCHFYKNSDNSTYFDKIPDDQNSDKIQLLSDFSVTYTDSVPLYNTNEEIVAYYMPGIDDGYAILDVEGNVVEYCYSDTISEIEDSENDCYYSGPGVYYVEDDKNKDLLVNAVTRRKIKKELAKEFEVVENDLDNQNKENVITEKNSYTITFPDSTTGSNGKKTYTDINYNVLSLSKKVNLPYNTRYFSYNTEGTCGSTAAAIFMYYYYDHISTKYITSNKYIGKTYAKQTAFVNNFKTLIGDDGSGTGYKKVKNGINKYLKSINKTQNCKYVTKLNIITSVISKIMSCIDSSKPCIVGLNNEPVYGDHWVVGVGYAKYWGSYGRNTGYTHFIKVNNGWYSSKAKSIVYVNYKYVDGVIYLK